MKVMNKENLVNRNNYIDDMWATLSLDHAQNINREVFNDISNLMLDLQETYVEQQKKYNNEDYKYEQANWVCDAPMGHGKSTVITAWLKSLTSNKFKTWEQIPVLIAVRNNEMGYELEESLNDYKEGSALYVDSGNKEVIKELIPDTQFLIISHARLKLLRLSVGNLQNYNTWINKQQKYVKKRKRILLIDEMPSWENELILDIGGGNNNPLKWFDSLLVNAEMPPHEAQFFRSILIGYIGKQLYFNKSDYTTRLIPRGDEEGKKLLETINQLPTFEGNRGEVAALIKLKLLSRLLRKDKYGRIDDFFENGKNIGRKIIISKNIDYKKLGMNTVIFDGTANVSKPVYVLRGYNLKNIENRNDYSRLTYNVREIKTTNGTLDRADKAYQKAILDDIKKVKELHPDLVILCPKSDISFFKSSGVINEEDLSEYEDNGVNKAVNVFNTTGFNKFKDRKSIYITKLPKMHPDYYKTKIIALSDDVIKKTLDISLNTDSKIKQWFTDTTSEIIYSRYLVAEILQIIHRTALRKIDEKDQINVFMAYDDEASDGGWSISETLNSSYFNYKARVKTCTVTNPYLFNRNDKAEAHATIIKAEIENRGFGNREFRLSELGKVGKDFTKWLNNKNKPWHTQREIILEVFSKYGMKIIEKGASKVKYIQVTV
jgi:hypothetical protein